MKNKISVFIIGLISGIIGACLYSFIHEFNKDLIKHFIDWPFLGFLLIILFITVFYNQIVELLKRGKLKIKYGNTEILLEQLPTLIEQEIETKLEQENPDETKLEDSNKNTTLEKIKDLYNIKSDNLALIIFHLGSSKYKWRNLKTLTKRTGLDENNIKQIVNVYPDFIIRGVGQTGNTIYRLNEKNKILFDEKVK